MILATSCTMLVPAAVMRAYYISTPALRPQHAACLPAQPLTVCVCKVVVKHSWTRITGCAALCVASRGPSPFNTVQRCLQSAVRICSCNLLLLEQVACTPTCAMDAGEPVQPNKDDQSHLLQCRLPHAEDPNMQPSQLPGPAGVVLTLAPLGSPLTADPA